MGRPVDADLELDQLLSAPAERNTGVYGIDGAIQTQIVIDAGLVT